MEQPRPADSKGMGLGLVWALDRFKKTNDMTEKQRQDGIMQK
jgi:hypothetical protein